MAEKRYILAPFPHMVLNAHDVPPPDYEMWHSWKVDSSVSPHGMAEWIRYIAAEKAPDNKGLATLIFNSHGSPGKIHIGTGIREQDLNNFQILRKNDTVSLCAQIWIIACRVSADSDDFSSTAAGYNFCMKLAGMTLSEVTAAVREQDASGAVSIPPWHVDDWVGEVYTYYPSGVRVRRQ